MPLLIVFRNKLTTYYTNDKENREKKIEAIQKYVHQKKWVCHNVITLSLCHPEQCEGSEYINWRFSDSSLRSE